MEVVGAMQSDVLRRMTTEEEERNPQLRRVLLCRSAAHPLHARVVGHVLAILQLAALNLPAHTGIVYVIQALSMQGVRKRCRRDSGASLKTSQQLLGHSDLETTLNMYSHTVSDSQRNAVERVAGVLFGVLDPVGLNSPPADNAGRRPN